MKLSEIDKFTTVSLKAQLASLEVSHIIAVKMKPYNIGESLIIPAAIEMCEIMHVQSYAGALKAIPLSGDTVKQGIHDISEDIKGWVLSKIK